MKGWEWVCWERVSKQEHSGKFFRVLTSLKSVLNCFGRKPWRVLNKRKMKYIYILTSKDYTRVQKKTNRNINWTNISILGDKRVLILEGGENVPALTQSIVMTLRLVETESERTSAMINSFAAARLASDRVSSSSPASSSMSLLVSALFSTSITVSASLSTETEDVLVKEI